MTMKICCGYTIPITLFGLPPSPEDHLKGMEIAAQIGFRAVELEFYDVLRDEHCRDFDKMKATLQENGLVVPSIMVVIEKLFSLDPKDQEEAIKDFDTLTDGVVALGSPLVAICGYMPPQIKAEGQKLYAGGPPTAVSVGKDFSWKRFWANSVAAVARCGEISARKGLAFIIETRANDIFSSTDLLVNLIRDAQALMASRGQQCEMGLILDVAHVHAGKEYLALVIPKLGSLIKMVHFSDNDGSFAYHYAPGKGNIDFKSVLRSLKRAGFDGYVVVDHSGIPNIVAETLRAKAYYEQLISEVEQEELQASQV